MKQRHSPIALALGLAFAAAGCTTLQEDPGVPTATQADVNYLREEIRRLHSRLDASDAEIGRVQGDVASAYSSQPAYASAAQVQALQTQLDAVQRQIQAVDAARAQDKKEIYDDIAKKVAALLKNQPSASGAKSSSRSASHSGWEHVVQPGETLSVIAAAYKVKASAIVDANKLKSPDSIFAGQKLFIPD
ncbi:MAG: LysM peptidoglycan-binding domain-containing protein [Kiritimatiellia bacterium]